MAGRQGGQGNHQSTQVCLSLTVGQTTTNVLSLWKQLQTIIAECKKCHFRAKIRRLEADNDKVKSERDFYQSVRYVSRIFHHLWQSLLRFWAHGNDATACKSLHVICINFVTEWDQCYVYYIKYYLLFNSARTSSSRQARCRREYIRTPSTLIVRHSTASTSRRRGEWVVTNYGNLQITVDLLYVECS